LLVAWGTKDESNPAGQEGALDAKNGQSRPTTVRHRALIKAALKEHVADEPITSEATDGRR